MKKLLLTTLLLLTPVISYGQMNTTQGGTGTSSPFGILYGDGSLRLKTVTIGSNLTFSGGTLSASGGSGGSGSVSTSTADVATRITYFTSNSATPALIGGEAGFTYNSATDLFSFPNATGTLLTIGDLFIGNTATVIEDNDFNFTGFAGRDIGFSAATGVAGAGGRYVAAGGNGANGFAGGDVQFSAGAGGNTGGGDGGDVIFEAGSGASDNANGGDVTFLAGAPAGSGTAGNFVFTDPVAAVNGILEFSSLNTSDKTFTFPNQSGTLCIVGVACDGAGSGFGAYWQSSGATGFLYNATTTDKVGVGTTSPMGKFSVHARGADALQYLFTVSTSTLTSTTTVFYVDRLGDANISGALSLGTDLTVANGGTGVSTLTDHGVLVGSGASAIDALAVGTNGQLLVGSTGADPVFATLNCADNLTCTLGAGTLEIDLDASLVSLTGIVSTGAIDFGGAVLEISNGTGPTADDVGELAHDTTDNQLILDDFVVGKATELIWSSTFGSTSVAFIGGGLFPVPPRDDGYTITHIECYVYGGTSKVIAIEDASANSTEDITCGTTVTDDDGSITNGTFTSSEIQLIDFGATTGAVDYVSISVHGQWTRE